jgi:hypothetical protein
MIDEPPPCLSPFEVQSCEKGSVSPIDPAARHSHLAHSVERVLKWKATRKPYPLTNYDPRTP